MILIVKALSLLPAMLVGGGHMNHAAQQQPKAAPPGVPLEWGYAPSKQQPLELARLADKTLSQVRDAACDIATDVDDPNGQGLNNGFAEIRDPQHIRIQYPVWNSRLGLSLEALIRNGDTVLVISRKGPRRFHVSSKPPAPMQNLASKWPGIFPSIVLLSAVDHSTPISSYVASALHDPANYTVAAEERTIKEGFTLRHSERIVITRKGDAIRKLGKARVFIAFTHDSGRVLPVRILSEYTVPGKKPSRVMWTANWVGPKKFRDKDFLLHK